MIYSIVDYNFFNEPPMVNVQKHNLEKIREFNLKELYNQKNLNHTFRNLKNTSENLKSITDSISNVQLSHTIRSFTQTVESLNKIVSTIESGEGTVGKLINDEILYLSLAAASKELESLLSDLKNHPKRYVHFSLFGKTVQNVCCAMQNMHCAVVLSQI